MVLRLKTRESRSLPGLPRRHVNFTFAHRGRLPERESRCATKEVNHLFIQLKRAAAPCASGAFLFFVFLFFKAAFRSFADRSRSIQTSTTRCERPESRLRNFHIPCLRRTWRAKPVERHPSLTAKSTLVRCHRGASNPRASTLQFFLEAAARVAKKSANPVAVAAACAVIGVLFVPEMHRNED